MPRPTRALILLLVLLVTLRPVLGGDVWNPPPFPDDLPPFPDDPPDVWTDPFDPINDLPDPIDIPPPPEDPWDDLPLPDPWDLPDPPELDDPFPDLPSFENGDLFDDIPDIPLPPPLGFAGESSHERAEAELPRSAAANVVTAKMAFPMRLPFHPVLGMNRAPVTKRVCNPATASRLIIPETKASSVAFVATCPPKVTARVPVGFHPVGIAGTPDGRFVFVTVAGTSSVAVIDLSTKTVVANIALPPLDGFPAQPAAITILPDGSRAYVNDHVDLPGSAVYVIDVASRTVKTTIRMDGFPASVAATPDGSQVWVSSRGYNTVSIIDTLTDTIIRKLTGIPEPTGVTFLPNGTRAYVAAGIETGGYVQVYDTANYAPVAQITVGNLPHVVKVSPTGRLLFVTNPLSDYISMINTSTNTVIKNIKVGPHALGLAFIN